VVIIFFISIFGHRPFASFQLIHADATSLAADGRHRFSGLVIRSYILLPMKLKQRLFSRYGLNFNTNQPVLDGVSAVEGVIFLFLDFGL